MERHVLDTDRTRQGGARTRAYARIEREERPAPAAIAAQRRPLARGTARLREFLRIARGRTA